MFWLLCECNNFVSVCCAEWGAASSNARAGPLHLLSRTDSDYYVFNGGHYNRLVFLISGSTDFSAGLFIIFSLEFLTKSSSAKQIFQAYNQGLVSEIVFEV